MRQIFYLAPPRNFQPNPIPTHPLIAFGATSVSDGIFCLLVCLQEKGRLTFSFCALPVSFVYIDIPVSKFSCKHSYFGRVSEVFINYNFSNLLTHLVSPKSDTLHTLPRQYGNVFLKKFLAKPVNLAVLFVSVY